LWNQLDRNDRGWSRLIEARNQEHDKDAWVSKVTDSLQDLKDKYNFQEGLNRMLGVTKFLRNTREHEHEQKHGQVEQP
jgi:hypothetical protein